MPIRFGQITLRTSELLPFFSAHVADMKTSNIGLIMWESKLNVWQKMMREIVTGSETRSNVTLRRQPTRLMPNGRPFYSLTVDITIQQRILTDGHFTFRTLYESLSILLV